MLGRLVGVVVAVGAVVACELAGVEVPVVQCEQNPVHDGEIHDFWLLGIIGDELPVARACVREAVGNIVADQYVVLTVLLAELAQHPMVFIRNHIIFQ